MSMPVVSLRDLLAANAAAEAVSLPPLAPMPVPVPVSPTEEPEEDMAQEAA
ncbi:hypothetical protein PV682_20595 [Streptomyces niveiscabiei]|uniref:hypothetical protein n=1 Tax=Streptomyces niveiscabiei TaxID=164115 RepID=UPI0029B6D80E|nr:hypothetical protein [Streptomyces niveiscabiei]MDX3383844.1 hypothetical protein [Streptomyces niveiscabiei]